jgi:hypothetical protein
MAAKQAFDESNHGFFPLKFTNCLFSLARITYLRLLNADLAQAVSFSRALFLTTHCCNFTCRSSYSMFAL